jgi:hypothetical protein
VAVYVLASLQAYRNNALKGPFHDLQAIFLYDWFVGDTVHPTRSPGYASGITGITPHLAALLHNLQVGFAA